MHSYVNYLISRLDKSRHNAVFALSICGLLSLGLLAIQSPIEMASAQESQIFKVIVQITNNGEVDEYGAVNVDIDGAMTAQWQSGQIFPAHQTNPYTFTFSSSDVPVGTGFTAEVVYGDDSHRFAYGSNSPSNAPETVSISIP
jgi:hypothetical protein